MIAELYGIEHEGVRWINLLPQEAPILKHNVAALDRVAGPLDVVMDIGAHVGFTSLLAAKRGARKVYAFEPNVWNFARLVNNLELNELAAVVPICAAVVGNSGGAPWGALQMCPGSPGQSSLAYGTHVSEFCLCPLLNAGDVLKAVAEGGPVDYLKIDCEGGEYDLLNWLYPSDMRNVRVISLELHDVSDQHYFPPGMPTTTWAHERVTALGFMYFGDGLWARSKEDVK